MKYLLSFLLVFAKTYSIACTVCGCSASNQYLGILPQFHKHFIGVQYQHRAFRSEHPAHELGDPGVISRERFKTLQIWGRFNVGNRVQLFGFLPYVDNVKNEIGHSERVSGIGDATVLANIMIVSSRRQDLGWKHNLQAGGGIKLPTGTYAPAAGLKEDGLPNMQPGTNSWDFILNANYTIRRKTVGLNTDVSYTLTSPNSYQYKYGNRFSAGALAFYWYEHSDLTLLPQAGCRVDVTGPDYDNYRYGWKNDMTGGTQLYASMGVQTFFKRIGLQVMYHHPLAQHYADGRVKAMFKTDAGAFFLF